LFIAGRLPVVAEVLGPGMDEPAAVDALPPGPGFVFGKPVMTGLGGLFGQDNAQAARFRGALRDWAEFATDAAAAGQAPPRTFLVLPQVAGSVAEALRPSTTVARRLFATTTLAPHVRDNLVEVFDEIKYYP